MFFELSKLLRFFVVSPVSWMLILLVAFYFVKHKKVKYTLLGAVSHGAAVCGMCRSAGRQALPGGDSDGRFRAHERGDGAIGV